MRRGLRLLGSLGCAAALAGCDVHPAEEILSGPPAEVPLEVVGTSLPRDGASAGEEIVVRLSAAIDPATVGPRSLRVVRSDGRRPVRCMTRTEGSVIRIVPDASGGFPVGEDLRLRIEGSPSPRALRSRTGLPLTARFETTFRVQPAAVADLEGPLLVASDPADGALAVAPGTPVELHFSEPVDSGAVAAGDAVTLRVDGRVVDARVRASRDGRRLLVRASGAVHPGAAVEVEVHPCLLDRAGNPLRASSPRRVSFRTRASSLHEIVEEFVCDDMADPEATGCAWGEPSNPGFLVPRCATTPLGGGTESGSGDLGEREVVRFLLLVRGDDEAPGIAAGLRVRFAAAGSEDPLRSATIDGGPYESDVLDPSFEGSRRGARLERLAEVGGSVAWEALEDGGALAEIPFSEPLHIEPGTTHLLDVTLRPAPGVRVAASACRGRRVLVEGGARERLAPAASLLVVGATPGARSRWYDANVERPRWGTAQWTLDADDPGVRVAVEFQSAPAGFGGTPDEDLASPWEDDLARLPRDRFVRFRVRFEGTPVGDRAPRADRIVMPYVAETP